MDTKIEVFDIEMEEWPPTDASDDQPRMYSHYCPNCTRVAALQPWEFARCSCIEQPLLLRFDANGELSPWETWRKNNLLVEKARLEDELKAVETELENYE